MSKIHFGYLVVLFLAMREAIGELIDWNKHRQAANCWGDENFTLEYIEKPIEVGVRILILDLYDLDETKMEFKCQIYVLKFWKDPFLDLRNVEIGNRQFIPAKVTDCLWKPDIVFRIFKDIEVIDEQSANYNYKLLPGGIIYHYNYFIMTVSCKMRFHHFPMDTQICPLEISFLHSRDKEAKLKWFVDYSESVPSVANNNVFPMEPLSTTRFFVETPHTSYKSKKYNTGNTTALILKFRFTRFLTSSVINTYIPSFLVVSLSFVSFWLEVTAVPGRVTLGVTALLTLATQMDPSRSNLPRVNYMTGLDVWLLGCQILVFLSLAEFVMANSYYRRISITKKDKDSKVAPNAETISVKSAWVPRTNADVNEERPRSRLSQKNENALQKVYSTDSFREMKMSESVKPNYSISNPIDYVAKFLFPILMVSFTTIYWFFYFMVSNNIPIPSVSYRYMYESDKTGYMRLLSQLVFQETSMKVPKFLWLKDSPKSELRPLSLVAQKHKNQ